MLRPPIRRLLCSSAPAGASLFRGVWPIMATPFRPDEAVDLDGFRKAVRFMAAAGADGITITGVLGESNRLTDAEREALIVTAVDAARTAPRPVLTGPATASAAAGAAGAGGERTAAAVRPPLRVCVGTSHAGTFATVALSRMAMELGADGVMVTPTKEPAPHPPEALVELYAAVARGCPGLPIVLQDHPASTQVFMPPPLLARITREVPSVACIKLESLPSPVKIAALRRLWRDDPPAGGKVTILTGLGALYGGFDLEQGTEGFMTGFAFPEILIAMNTAAQAGDFERAHLIYNRFLPLLVFEQQPGIGVRKAIYQLRGLIDSPRVRHPGMGAPPVLLEALEKQIRRSLPGIDVTKPLPPEMFA